MKNIAVIGWGSLIWSPGRLELQSGWRRDGPLLPVEFARVSQDGRLTLVIVESDEVDEQRALWALSGFSDIESAIENLRARERTTMEWIGNWDGQPKPRTDIEGKIAGWCEERTLEGAVWAALPPRDKNGNKGKVMPHAEAIKYLNDLDGDCRERAKEYIQKAPNQINTKMRQLVRSQLGWLDLPSATSLFEDPA